MATDIYGFIASRYQVVRLGRLTGLSSERLLGVSNKGLDEVDWYNTVNTVYVKAVVYNGFSFYEEVSSCSHQGDAGLPPSEPLPMDQLVFMKARHSPFKRSGSDEPFTSFSAHSHPLMLIWRAQSKLC